MQTSDKIIVITGASSGIGAALAKIFSDAGYHLGLLARNLHAMENLNLKNSLCLAVDVTDFTSFKNAIVAIEQKYSPIDCLINCAGFAKGGDFTELTHDDHVNTVNINLQGVMNGVEAVLPSMRERKGGTIINISSVADRNARPNIASYAAAKAAVKSLTESLRMANAKYGIRICNIAPAKINTPMLMSAKIHDEPIIEAGDFAKTVLWVYQQPQTICIRDMVVAPTFYEP